MQEIKYQPLKNCDDDFNTLQPLDHSENNYIQECRKHWFLKVLLIFFIIIKAIYIINNYDNIINWLQSYNNNNNYNQEIETNYNQTDKYENFSSLYSAELTTITYDKLKNGKLTLTTTISSSINNSNSITENSNRDAIFITTTKDISANYIINTTSNNYENTTKKLYNDGETMENKLKTNNDYGNVDLTTTTTTTSIKAKIHLKDDFSTTTKQTTRTNFNSNNKITLETPTTKKYLNTKIITSTLWQTTEIITDPPTTTSTTTTTKRPMTTSPLKTPAVKPYSSEDEKKYFINTSHCHIPFVDPFTTEIHKIFKPQHSTGCTKDQPIISVTFNESNGQYILKINYKVAENLRKTNTKQDKPIEEDLSCCYQEIIRSGSGTNVDASFKLLPCTNFHQNFVVPLHINGIIVNCKSSSKKSILQQDAFSFVQVNKTLIEQESRNTTIGRRKPSILMIGIDSLSRINFRRNMPEMLKYLVDNKWYELRGYNKVGDNTLPNLMPLLTGYSKETVYKKCQPQKVGGFDNCNFIWTTFKNNGYHTAYAEDSSIITTFNYKLKGFKKPPTDYYFRPLALAIEKSLKKTTKANLYYCAGRRQLGEYIYDNAMDFVTRFKNLSSFGFFWTNSFSHNSYDIAATMDKRMVEYFKEWEKRGIIENSVVIFFSDHGVRWGPLLKLSQGFLEERLPMFFISLPKWFHQEYPDLVQNLDTNQHRLASPFDIHMTLQHLLQLGEPSYKIQQSLDCPKCQSIFEELPENRTCDDASIPETWCTCLPFKKESTKSELVKTIAKMIIKEMNHYYENKNLTSICSPLQLNEITNAKVRTPEDLNSPNNVYTYVIDFTTLPKTEPKTLFSATVNYDVQNKNIHLNVEDISRQSLYENTAKCTDDKQAKKYCICKNSLKKS